MRPPFTVLVTIETGSLGRALFRWDAHTNTGPRERACAGFDVRGKRGKRESYFRGGSWTRITRSAESSLTSCTIPEGQRISTRLADAAPPSPKCTGPALEEAYPAANDTWLYCTVPPAVILILAPMPSRLLFEPSNLSSTNAHCRDYR